MLKEGRIYLLANIVNRASGLLMLPILTRWLTAADYGIYALLVSLMEMLSMVCGVGLAQAISRLYFEYAEEDVRRGWVVSTAVLMMIFLVILSIVLAPFISEPLSYAVTGSIANSDKVAVALPAVPCGVLLEIYSSYYIVRKKPISVLLLATAKASILFGVTILFLIEFDYGVWGVFLAQSLAFSGVSMLIALRLFYQLGLVCNLDIAKGLLKFGLPLVPSALADTLLTMSARWIVNYNLGPSYLGALALGQRIASVIQSFISSPFAQVFFVKRIETLAEGKPQLALNQSLSGFMIVLGLAVFWIGIFSPEIIKLLAPNGYQDAVRILPLVCFNITLAAVNLHVEAGLMYTKRTWVLPLQSLVTLAFTLPLIWAGSYYCGLEGAAAMMICVSLIRFWFTLKANQRWGVPEIAENWGKGFLTLLLLGLLAYLGQDYMVYDLPLWQMLLAKTLLLIFFTLLLGISPLAQQSLRRLVGL